jgi:hypothetical protein
VRLAVSCAVLLLTTGSPVRAATDHPYTAAEAGDQGEFEVRVALDSEGQRGRANAMVRIRARREVVWSLIKSCVESVKLVPGLAACDVLETAPDGSWQTIREVLDYSWFVPKLTYEIRATYDYPGQISIERISGDLRVLEASWNLQDDGDYTIARYQVELAPGFWVPQWLVRGALRHDLPKLLRALRARAELVQRQGSASRRSH